MAVEQAQIMDGLYSWLTAASTFNTAVGGRVRQGQADPEETLPYCVLTVVSMGDFHAMDKSGTTLRIQVDVYDVEGDGPRSLMAIWDTLMLRLDRAIVTATGHELIPAFLDNARGPLLEDQAWRISGDFLISGFET